MKVEPLSTTYARALMDLAAEKGRLREVLEDIRGFAAVFRRERDFRIFLESPAISSQAKAETLEKVFRGHLDDMVLDFLQVVVRRRRHSLFEEIFAQCEELYDQAVGRVHVQAVTATELSEARKQELMEALRKKLRKEVVLVSRVEPEVLGGLVIRYGDLVADDSLRTALAQISSRMMTHKPGSELVHEDQSR